MLDKISEWLSITVPVIFLTILMGFPATLLYIFIKFAISL